MKIIKRAILTVALVVIAFSFISFLTIAGVYIYARKNVNFETDEMLFEEARSWESTSFFASSTKNKSTLSGYKPFAIESAGALRKTFYSYEDMPESIIRGFVAVEDKIFFEHSGIDLKRTLAAAVNYVLKREKLFGASTITQQVVKNVSGDNEVKLARKFNEIIRACRIEKNYTKREILEVYLNVIPMSENIYGIGAASLAYFGKEPRDMTVGEAATLIGITNAPTKYNPYNNPKACEKKRNTVLSVMYADGVISKDEYEAAIATPLSVIAREERYDRFDSWFVEKVIDDVSEDLAKKYSLSESAARMMLLGGGYSVYTTMDTDVQGVLEKYFENTENFPIESKQGLNFSMVVIDTETGCLSGIVGRVGKKEGNRLLNHATVPHIPGSTLKPLALYAPLIDEGKINLATVLDDVPVSFYEKDGEYREYPRNSPAVYDGLTTIKDAIRTSKNTVAVRLANIRTARRIFDSLKNDFGFDTLVEREENENGTSVTDVAVSPLALGQLTYGVSLFKLTEAFTAFSRGGVKGSADSYVAVTDNKGKIILEKTHEEERVFKESTANIMNYALSCVVESGTAKSVSLKNLVDTAGKTGTSGGGRDKLFVGYTPYYTAGIWCGYDTGGVAVSGAPHLSVWDDVMCEIHEKLSESEEITRAFSTEGLVYRPFCLDSGRLYSDVCRYDVRGTRVDYAYFTIDNMPSGECDRHVICLYDSVTKGIATKGCAKEDLVAVSLIKISDRKFPKQIFVTDAEYVFRDIGAYVPRPIDYSLPYFQYAIPEGEYVGITDRKKQFNSNCYLHDE